MRLLLAATVASTFTAIITILYPAHASEADASLVKYGEYLAIAADCSGCHNSATKGLMAGGLALHSPMGDIFAPNITPDKKTGIGSWVRSNLLMPYAVESPQRGDHFIRPCPIQPIMG